MERMTVRLLPDDMRDLQALAAYESIEISQLARVAIGQWLTRHHDTVLKARQFHASLVAVRREISRVDAISAESEDADLESIPF